MTSLHCKEINIYAQALSIVVDMLVLEATNPWNSCMLL